MGKIGQIGARLGKGSEVWMGQTDRRRCLIWLVGECGYGCWSRDGCGQVWADMGKGGQVWIGQTDLAGMFDMTSGWVWVCLQG